jgi:argininosuccinate lyase
MKPYEEIEFPNGFIRWIREGNEYVCRMSEEYMEKMKAQHEVKREWHGLTDEDINEIHSEIKAKGMGSYKTEDIYRAIEAKLKEKNG